MLFALESGLKLGLWSRHHVVPEANAPGGGELGFPVGARQEVLDMHLAWSELGLRILQVPTAMEFGFTFTAVDPDGHRLRVFAPE